MRLVPVMRLRNGLAVLAVAAAGLLSGCATPEKVPFTHLKYWQGYSVPGYYYAVQTGDSLATIADRYGCDLELLCKINGTPSDRALAAGERIFVPRTRGDFPNFYYSKPRDSDPPQTARPARGDTTLDPALAALLASGRPPQGPTVVMAPNASARLVSGSPPTVFKVPASHALAMGSAEALAQPPPAPSALPSIQPVMTVGDAHVKGLEIAQTYTKRRVPNASRAVVANHPPFQWPTGGRISSIFNIQSRGVRLHNGIDLAVPRGTAIRAACAGRVLYSDNKYLPSMGNMVLLEHAGGWVTLYAHNDRNLVREGETVQAGQTIALAGATGNATGSHLHFEIRKDADTPVDPIPYLPPLK